jgi:hypothetical protein
VPTNRTPIRRPAAATITPRALEAFRRLVELEAQCVGPPECEPYKRCAACDQWWVEQWTIRRELGLKPWEFAVEREGTGDWPPTKQRVRGGDCSSKPPPSPSRVVGSEGGGRMPQPGSGSV